MLVKGGNYLETLKKIDTIIFDKTGTLTEGVFEVTEVKAYNGINSHELLKIAAYAESHSNHPIAISIKKILWWRNRRKINTGISRGSWRRS